MFAKQHLEPWASFAELSTKHGKIVPQRPTIKVNFFFFYWLVFLLEQKCFVGLFLCHSSLPYCTRLHTVTDILYLTCLYLFFYSTPKTAEGGDSLLCRKCEKRTWTTGCDGHPGNHEQCYQVLQGSGFYRPWTPEGGQPRHPWCAEKKGEQIDFGLRSWFSGHFFFLHIAILIKVN